MNIIFLFAFLLLSLLFLLCLFEALKKHFVKTPCKNEIQSISFLLFCSISIFVWTVYATNNLPPESYKVSYIPIEEKRNTIFFQRPDGSFVELMGSYKFVDTNKNQIKYTIQEGTWNYGMYVIEIQSWDVVPKSVE